MPITLEDGSLWPTPEETVVALLEQGYTPAEIIATAEDDIATAEADIAYVDAVANDQSAKTVALQRILSDATAALKTYKPADVAQAALDLSQRNGPAVRSEIHDALEDVQEGTHFVNISADGAVDAHAAATAHQAQRNETITNAQQRIAAAQTPELVAAAQKHHQELEAAAAARTAEAEAAEKRRAKNLKTLADKTGLSVDDVAELVNG